VAIARSQPPRHIALVKLSALGDVVHALPVAAAVKRTWPAARLTWVVERRLSDVLAGHAAVDEVVEVDTRGWRRARRPREVARAVGQMRAVRRRLRALDADVALDLQSLLKSAVLTRATRAPRRIGFAARRSREPLSALFLTDRVTPSPDARHVVEQYLAMLEPLGVRGPAVDFGLAVDAAAETRVEEFFDAAGLKRQGRLVVINPGAGRADKRWPVERFRALAARLAQEAEAAVLVVWGPGEQPAAAAIADAGAARAVLAPPTSITELIAILRRASVMVAADTGPLHLAAALRTPCVGLYGPTSATRNGPYGHGHHVLQSADRSMTGVSVASAFDATAAALGA
jgi:lipopolysaccharide heptosyltransferase I